MEDGDIRMVSCEMGRVGEEYPRSEGVGESPLGRMGKYGAPGGGGRFVPDGGYCGEVLLMKALLPRVRPSCSKKKKKPLLANTKKKRNFNKNFI